MDKRFMIILGIIIVLFAGFFVFNQKSTTTNSSASSSLATNHTLGKGSKGVVLTEYGDYECPVCFSYYQPLKDAMAQVNDTATFQFRNLPLSQIHKNAFSSARAAEAAGLQGKYFEMHDLLYENQDPAGKEGWVASNNALEDYYVKFAQSLSLDLTKFRSDFASSKVNDAINADVSEFLNTPYVNHDTKKEATPTFFLDGKYIENSKLVDDQTGKVSAAKIVALINDAISKKSQ